MICPLSRSALALVATLVFGPLAQADTQVIMLGTGTPVPDPERAGAGVAVVVDGTPYLFDAGSGVHHRAIQAMQRYQLPALNPQELRYVFLTHLHSDHIHDLDNFAMSRWWSRNERLEVYGPVGLAAYVEHMNAMAGVEATLRSAGTPPEIIVDRAGYIANAHEVVPGLVFENEQIKIEAFYVPHGDIEPALGYKITTADKTIVISGDTTTSEEIARQAQGVDLLIHEVMSGDLLDTQSEFWQLYHGQSHTRAADLGRLAQEVGPKTLVLYHVLFFTATPDDIVNEVKRHFDGSVVLANDLDAF